MSACGAAIESACQDESFNVGLVKIGAVDNLFGCTAPIMMLEDMIRRLHAVGNLLYIDGGEDWRPT